MKRKVKRYDKGGVLTDSSGNPVRSSSGEPVRTRFGKEEDRPKAGPDDYATMGKRAGATSTMSGPKEYISESIKEDTVKDTEKESPKGIASGSPAADDSDIYAPKTRTFSTTGPEKKKARPKPRYSGVVSAGEMGSQDFSSKAKPKPTGDSGLSKAAIAAGLGLAGAAGAGLLASRRGSKESAIPSKIEPNLESRRSLSGSTVGKMPGPSSSLSDPYSMTLGSDLDPKTSLKRNSRLSKDADFKKGGQTKRMASGGKVSSASSRGDGIAQRGKTKGRIC
jgi:hypothetical protein